MAIIRLDCNLNGGDSVTPNNELFYRIYGDIDAYAAPIHETGTALSDANVTVNNDNVIITGVDGTTNTEFKISAVDGAGNEGILSDAFLYLTSLLHDDFTGTTIDTEKWAITNPDTADVDITQNNELLMESTGVSTTALYDNTVLSVDAFDASGLLVLRFDARRVDAATSSDSGNVMGFGQGNHDNCIVINTVSASATEVQLIARINSGNIIAATETADFDGSWKIVKALNGDISYYRWGGSSWVQVGSTTSSAYTAGTLNVQTTVAASLGNVYGAAYDNLYVTDTDYESLTPS